MSDDTERMYELHDEFDIEAQRYEAGRAAATAASGEDESQTIRVDLDGDVPVVTVRDGWRRHYGPDALGSAILEVFAAIGVKRFEQSQEAVADADPRARPIPTLGGTPAGLAQAAVERQGEQLDPMAMLGRLTDMIDTITAGMDETVRTIVARGSTPREAASVPGHVTAEVRGNVLSILHFDEDWLDRAGPAEISREANEAITAAVRRANEETPTNPLEDTPLAGFTSVLGDPEALSRYLLGAEDFSTRRTEGR